MMKISKAKEVVEAFDVSYPRKDGPNEVQESTRYLVASSSDDKLVHSVEWTRIGSSRSLLNLDIKILRTLFADLEQRGYKF
jgi:hypothetical protein